MTGQKALKWIENNKEKVIDIGQKIWEYAEVGLQEHKSSKLLAEVLEEHGFEIEYGVAGMPTAFVAKYGSGSPKIGLLAEYDALPHLSNKAIPEQEPLKEDAPGHGCGHNIYGSAVMAAAIGLKEEIDTNDLEGTIIFYGCPAEETLVGKVYMAREGLFDDLDLSLTWHPGNYNAVSVGSSNAMNSVKFNFHGRTAHAAGDPHNGRSALDAVELMNIGVNYLREHVIPTARLHYVITNGGGEPNVVPDKAQVWYYVRAPKRSDVDEIYERVVKIAKGAAMMTGTTMDIEFLSGCYNTLMNHTLAELILESMKEVGPNEWTEEEIEFAKEINETYQPGMKMRAVERYKLDEKYLDMYLHDEIHPEIIGKEKKGGGGSTDVADVSWITPTAQFNTATSVFGNPGHSWQVVAASGMGIGQKGSIQAAKILALTVSKLLRDEDLVKKAKEEFKESTKGQPYESPVPEGVEPPLTQLKEQ